MGWESWGNGEGLADAYRVWEIKANREERQRMQRLYLRLSSAVRQACKALEERLGKDFREDPKKFSEELIGEASKTAGLPKGLFWYAVEWRRMVAEAKGKSKRRSGFTPPPVPLLVKVVGNGDRLHGNGSAVAVLEASRNELRIPSAGVAVRLRPSLVKAVLEDVQRFGDVKLTLQLTAKGRLRLIAHRVVKQVRWGGEGRLAVIALDVNSSHGLYLMAFTFDSNVRLVAQRVFKPPNTTLLRLLAAIMTSYSEVKCWSEAVKRFRQRRDVRSLQREGRGSAVEGALRLAERLRAKINLTSERAEHIAGQASRKVRKLNEDWVRGVLKELRALIRKLRDQGYTVVIVVDVPQAESLRGTKLQRTLLRAARRLENMAWYEGARWFKPDNNISGKRCPICGKEGVEVQRRYYKCPKCNLVYGRDWTAAFNAAKLFLRVCRAERHLEALSQWLQSHKTALTPAGPGPSSPGSPSRGGPGVPRAARGGDVPAATRAEGRPARAATPQGAPMTPRKGGPQTSEGGR
ncbi:transposase [Infirmifilum sp. NZ]|uniref:transposase n=1 Tax=Infirmifilum sp. NZ TaxID=2926850 RepID=UPI0027A10B7C|nr:transposase [Infirmifilum sp. NZ]UNQ73963.1 transposase [Infirmifilum sp. NZ]